MICISERMHEIFSHGSCDTSYNSIAIFFHGLDPWELLLCHHFNICLALFSKGVWIICEA